MGWATTRKAAVWVRPAVGDALTPACGFGDALLFDSVCLDADTDVVDVAGREEVVVVVVQVANWFVVAVGQEHRPYWVNVSPYWARQTLETAISGVDMHFPGRALSAAPQRPPGACEYLQSLSSGCMIIILLF